MKFHRGLKSGSGAGYRDSEITSVAADAAFLNLLSRLDSRTFSTSEMSTTYQKHDRPALTKIKSSAMVNAMTAVENLAILLAEVDEARLSRSVEAWLNRCIQTDNSRMSVGVGGAGDSLNGFSSAVLAAASLCDDGYGSAEVDMLVETVSMLYAMRFGECAYVAISGRIRGHVEEFSYAESLIRDCDSVSEAQKLTSFVMWVISSHDNPVIVLPTKGGRGVDLLTVMRRVPNIPFEWMDLSGAVLRER